METALAGTAYVKVVESAVNFLGQVIPLIASQLDFMGGDYLPCHLHFQSR